MAEHMRASQSKSTKFYGTLVVCPTPGVRIVKIDEPSLGERYFTLRRSDFPQEAVLSICGGTMPVLSEEKIVYEGQPVLALFGPDSESVVLMARQFALETAPLEKEEALDLDEGAVNEITIGTPPASLEGLREVAGSIHFKGITQPSPARVECECWQEGEKLHVELPTQWPALVATNLARILSMAPADVVVHQMPCSPDADEYLIQPTLMAIVCAMAALKAGVPTVLSWNVSSVRPDITVTRRTWCDDEGHLVSEECRLDASLGAFQIEDEEFIRQSMAGLVPNYDVPHFHAVVTTHRSSTMPSVFHGGAGYSQALASVEAHATDLARAFETPPSSWKALHLKVRRPFTDYMPSVELDELNALVDMIDAESDFKRKWASYSTQTDEFSVLPFNRGIGLATGISIAGFSTSYAKEHPASAKLTLTEKHNVTLLTSFPERDGWSEGVKRAVMQEVDLTGDKDVIILDNDGCQIDSGPAILDRQRGQFPYQLSQACIRLNLEGKGEDAHLPWSQIFNCDESLMPCEFEPRGMAALIVELRLDDIDFQPVALGAWVAATYGTLDDQKTVKAQIRHAVVRALRQSGIALSCEASRPFKVEMHLSQDSSLKASSLDQALDALARSATLSALRQCLSHIEPVLPTSPAQMEKAVMNRGGQE